MDMSAIIMVGGSDTAQASKAETAFSAAVDELFWFGLGIAIIQGLVYLGYLPSMNLGLFSPIGGRGKKEAQCVVEKMRSTGMEDKVQEMGRNANYPQARSAEVHSFTSAIRGFIKGGELDAAVQQMLLMQGRGLDVPPKLVMELFKAARSVESNAVQHAFDGLGGIVQLPIECFSMLLYDCLQHEDYKFARQLDRLACAQNKHGHYSVYEPLLKLFAKSGDTRAGEIFRQMQLDGNFASEGLCGSLLARSGEGRNLCFAETVIDYLRGRSMMTLPIFKTLMKAYACCGRYDLACDLYEQVLAAGLEPDHVMYGCLVKFAVKCGRTELSEKLFHRTRGGDIQNFMCLIRAAGRSGKVDRAVELLREAESSRPQGADIAVYNCAIDACATNGRLDFARKLLDEASKKGIANLISYNTLLKGHGAQGDFAAARAVLRETEAAGIMPDSASYNCLMGSLVSAGHLAEAQEVLEQMERKAVPVDHYTVSIMMKAAKRARSPADAARALAVLDRVPSMDFCGDEVLFNTVLDACTQRQDLERLARVLKTFNSSTARPSVSTYGLLFKAFSLLKRIARCEYLWVEMVETRGMKPNSVALCCMLDAFICARQVEKAVALFREWKTKVTVNTVMYSTLVKGFAAAGEADRAMEMFDELRADGLPMNLVTYTSLIDAHARLGKMEPAKRLFELMEKEGCEPNVITFSALVKGYCTVGDVDEAFSVFFSMLSRGLAADTVIFNSLLDGCVRHSRFKLADELLAEMGRWDVQPSNFTLSIIIKMWGKRQQLDKAFEVVRASLEDERRFLDSQVGTSLISACLFNSRPDRALEVLADMKAWRNSGRPNEVTYGTLISGLVRCGDCRRAVAIAHEACEAASATRRSSSATGAARAALPEDCVKQLFAALRRQGLAEELGTTLVGRLRAARVRVPPC
eukprot:CAMPEP_0115465256 /NCGR_PEP_ID=MMETSP0271-20121206/49308_1 /TAXON_ID=71861 /ORGANISM="Scrippsiella trochoidea, Strain CCMP3099" /LENGTH=921 /DNA_ID=CAMNT_0002892193 /DNA_START=140 /DNA_END=2902 /DNA_ORIENTATION=-